MGVVSVYNFFTERAILIIFSFNWRTMSRLSRANAPSKPDGVTQQAGAPQRNSIFTAVRDTIETTNQLKSDLGDAHEQIRALQERVDNNYQEHKDRMDDLVFMMDSFEEPQSEPAIPPPPPPKKRATRSHTRNAPPPQIAQEEPLPPPPTKRKQVLPPYIPPATTPTPIPQPTQALLPE